MLSFKSLLPLFPFLLCAQAALIPVYDRRTSFVEPSTPPAVPARQSSNSTLHASTNSTAHFSAAVPNPSHHAVKTSSKTHLKEKQQPRSESESQCTPFKTTFESGSVASKGTTNPSEPFVALNDESAWAIGDGGLELYMGRPSGEVKTEDGVNDVVADGATVNSTFSLLYGKVTFEVQAPTVPGVVTAVILIAEEHDEIDVELLGGDTSHWQTNVYAPSPSDKEPLWGVFGDIEDYDGSGSVAEMHMYTIDWTEERIVWSVDGKAVRTLKPDETMKNGAQHYPSHAAKVQLGIWDASNPQGTSEWAHGPINWDGAPGRMKAVVKSVAVDCQ